ncbi:MAG TPA: DUF4910 domain-containing protein [Terriglobales bacterium]|nr:DUF4910 domain-containing protein [Terriglobales bacterium]
MKTATARAERSAFSGPPDPRRLGEEMHQLITELYPICRSLTGEGQRQTLDLLRGHIDLAVREVPSGTRVFDWTVPKEWNIRDAYIKDSAGNKIVDFQKNNLHVLNYSVPVDGRFSRQELEKHLFTLPEHPEWIPYRTSYYQPNWGFCLSHRQYLQLEEKEYEVRIDSSLRDGSLTYGEYYLPGVKEDEVIFSCHICHPSMANDNLSGIALATFLARELTSAGRRYSYRFLFTPGTIGSITWLCQNEERWGRIRGGLVLACVGDGGAFTYKKSRRGDSEMDRAVQKVLQDAGSPYEVMDFSPYGYDERQFCSPGINLPVGCFMRTPHGRFPEYHTSADDLTFVRPEHLAESFCRCWAVLQLLERNRTYLNLNPRCEPQLGARGLYSSIGGRRDSKSRELAMLWVLNMSDGRYSLLGIAERAGMSFNQIDEAARELQRAGLLSELPC